jgi:hypothetical protein
VASADLGLDEVGEFEGGLTTTGKLIAILTDPVPAADALLPRS